LCLTQIDLFLATQPRAFSAKLLVVQIKETSSQLQTPLYLPPGQKKRGVQGHINYTLRVDVKWGNLQSPEKKQKQRKTLSNRK
jgi:hypothetical protein